jgi:hypothetical protein
VGERGGTYEEETPQGTDGTATATAAVSQPRVEFAAYLREVIAALEEAQAALDKLQASLETIVASCERLRLSLGENPWA